MCQQGDTRCEEIGGARVANTSASRAHRTTGRLTCMSTTRKAGVPSFTCGISAPAAALDAIYGRPRRSRPRRSRPHDRRTARLRHDAGRGLTQRKRLWARRRSEPRRSSAGYGAKRREIRPTSGCNSQGAQGGGASNCTAVRACFGGFDVTWKSVLVLSFVSFYNSVDNTNVTMYRHLISQAG